MHSINLHTLQSIYILYSSSGMFLTLEIFLEHFPIVHISKEDFVNKFVITYSGRPTLHDLFSLKSVIKNKEDQRYINREAIIDYFYDVIIVNRHKYLSEFYKSYFELPNFDKLKWDKVDILKKSDATFNNADFMSSWGKYVDEPDENISEMKEQFDAIVNQKLPCISLQKNDGSRKIIRNLNYLDILHNTRVTNTCKSKTSFWETLINVYNKLELEDRFFAPSSIGLFLRPKTRKLKTGSDLLDEIQVNYNNFFYLFQQYQPKASILNPYTINWILKNLLTGSNLLTPVLSWSSYIVAFMNSDWKHYVGIDVMPQVCERTQFVFDYYDKKVSLNKPTKPNKKLDLYCQPSESLLYNGEFLSKYDEYFDAVLMCPPYFDMEIYPDNKDAKSKYQSTNVYPKYDEWLVKYWEDTVIMSHSVLKNNGKFAFIVNDYVSLKKQEYPLIQDLNLIALKYFKLVGLYHLSNRVSPLRVNYKKRTEMLCIYEK